MFLWGALLRNWLLQRLEVSSCFPKCMRNDFSLVEDMKHDFFDCVREEAVVRANYKKYHSEGVTYKRSKIWPVTSYFIQLRVSLKYFLSKVDWGEAVFSNWEICTTAFASICETNLMSTRPLFCTWKKSKRTRKIWTLPSTSGWLHHLTIESISSQKATSCTLDSCCKTRSKFGNSTRTSNAVLKNLEKFPVFLHWF